MPTCECIHCDCGNSVDEWGDICDWCRLDLDGDCEDPE